MSERLLEQPNDSASVAVALAAMARDVKEGGQSNPGTVFLGHGHDLDTAHPHHIEAGHWPGDGITVAGTIVDHNGATSEAIINIGSTGTQTTSKLPEIG